MAEIYSTGFTGISNGQKLEEFDLDWVRSPASNASAYLYGSTSGTLFSSNANFVVYAQTALGVLADCEVEADLVSTSGVVGAAGVAARIHATELTCYGARYSAGNVQLFKMVAGTFTQLGSNYAASFAAGETHRVGVRCSVDQLYATWDGVDVIGPITDSAIASGYAGIRTTSNSTNIHIDNFSVDNLAATNTSPSFTGPNIADISGTESVALTPVDVSSLFFDSESGLTFSAVGSWPAGVTVSSAGVISGTPTTAGTYASLQVRATDAGSLTADSNAFTITVAAPGDAENPTLTGSVTFASITQTSYTAQWPAGSDNVAVTGYEYQIGGTAGAWTDAGNNLSAAITGRTAGATETVYVRAYDAAGLRSTPAISGSVTLLSAAAGISVTEPLKNNTGTVLASQSGVRVAVLQAADLVSVFETSGLTTNASGILATISDAAIITGQQYHVAIKLADGGVGITGPITAS